MKKILQIFISYYVQTLSNHTQKLYQIIFNCLFPITNFFADQI